MNKKMILGVTLLTGAALLTFKDKIFGDSSTQNTPGNISTGGNTNTGGNTGSTGNTNGNNNAIAAKYEGGVVRTPNDAGWYRVINGKRVVYQSIEGYYADGSRQTYDLPQSEFDQIPSNTLEYINSSGKLVRW
ncbi:hypothetical protein [Flavobacterium sp. C4GT6]|uniref:hypothetical protein n=1 Tax=Flavobacterium sp. C4GT6 TaxID=3103818 RepID=UPI002ED5CB8E